MRTYSMMEAGITRTLTTDMPMHHPTCLDQTMVDHTRFLYYSSLCIILSKAAVCIQDVGIRLVPIRMQNAMHPIHLSSLHPLPGWACDATNA